MNDRKKGLIDSLNCFRERLKTINIKINSKRKTLIHIKQNIYDDIYILGDYCAKHLCSNDFNYSFVYRLIDKIERNQFIYDKLSKGLILLLEGKDDLLKNIDNFSKALGIENV